MSGKRRAPAFPSRGLKVILAKRTFMGSVSGADEALVRYALHLQRSGHLHSVALMHRPAADNPYLERLRSAGVAVHCVAVNLPPTARLMIAVWQTAIRLRLIPHPGAAATQPQRVIGSQSLTKRAWNRVLRSVTWRQALRVHKYFAASGADLVHVVGTDHGTPGLIAGARRARLPVLLHELGGPHHLPQQSLHYAALRGVLPECTEIAALSPLLASGWRDYYALSRPVRVLPLIYDDSPLRARGPSADGAVRIGYAARHEHGKGLMLLLDAFARVHATRPRARLVIAGVGPLEHEARRRAAAPDLAGSCDFLGYVSEAEKPSLLCNLDAFVLPTLSEGTPNGVLEAMLFGLPIIASRVGGIPDMLADGCGLLVHPGDIDALACALLRVIDDVGSRVDIGRRARQQYERLFRPDVVIEALLDEYRRVARPEDQRDGATRSHPWAQDDATTSSSRGAEQSTKTMIGAA